MSEISPSIIRTFVPIVAGFLASLLPFFPNEGTALAVSQTLVIAGYYAIFRVAEKWVSPKFGWALGLARPPAYAGPAKPDEAAPATGGPQTIVLPDGHSHLHLGDVAVEQIRDLHWVRKDGCEPELVLRMVAPSDYRGG